VGDTSFETNVNRPVDQRVSILERPLTQGQHHKFGKMGSNPLEFFYILKNFLGFE
jgi:hypothetical protein